MSNDIYFYSNDVSMADAQTVASYSDKEEQRVVSYLDDGRNVPNVATQTTSDNHSPALTAGQSLNGLLTLGDGGNSDAQAGESAGNTTTANAINTATISGGMGEGVPHAQSTVGEQREQVLGQSATSVSLLCICTMTPIHPPETI